MTDLKALQKVDWTPHAREYLHHLFRRLTSAEAARNLGCGRDLKGDVSEGCGRDLKEGDLVDEHFKADAIHFTPPCCIDCESTYLQGAQQDDWEWQSFNEDTWGAFLAGYVGDYPVKAVEDLQKVWGHRMHTAVERACYFDSLDRILSSSLPLYVGGAWFLENPSVAQELLVAKNYIEKVANNPSSNEKEWARFWWAVFSEAKVDMDKYPLLEYLLTHVGHRRNRLEILFED